MKRERATNIVALIATKYGQLSAEFFNPISVCIDFRYSNLESLKQLKHLYLYLHLDLWQKDPIEKQSSYITNSYDIIDDICLIFNDWIFGREDITNAIEAVYRHNKKADLLERLEDLQHNTRLVKEDIRQVDLGVQLSLELLKPKEQGAFKRFLVAMSFVAVAIMEFEIHKINGIAVWNLNQLSKSEK